MRILMTIAIATLFVACSSKTTHTDAKATPAATTSTKKDAKAATAQAAGGAVTKCTKGKDERTLEVITKGNGCEVSYIKGGQTTQPASSAKGNDYCNKVVAKIKGNLEKSGYTCN